MMLSKQKSKYWFPAKRYGWGWGLPFTWQGWTALTLFIVLLSVGAFIVDPNEHPLSYISYTIGLVAALIVTCLIKGEPLRWRWGK